MIWKTRDQGSPPGQALETPYARRSRLVLRWFIPLGLLWLLLWLLGFPPPLIDDLFHVGPGLELSRSGRLVNPLLRYWTPSAGDRYYFQPPFYPYALGGWLKLVGISTASLRGFQCIAGAFASGAFAAFFFRFRFSGAWSVPVFLVVMLATCSGLRHDTLAMALLAGGLAVLARAKPARATWGLVLVIASAATWPTLLCYAVPLTIMTMALRGGSAVSVSTLRGYALPTLVASALVSGLFLLAVRAEVTDFLRDFLWHASIRREPDVLAAITHQFTNGYEEFLLLPVFLLFLAAGTLFVTRWRRVRAEARALLLALAAGSLALMILYASAIPGIGVFFCWLGIAGLAGDLPVGPRLRAVFLGLSVAVFALTRSYFAIQVGATDWRVSPPIDDIRAALPASMPLGLDEVSARYVFDYRLPTDAFVWDWTGLSGDWPPSPAERPPGTAWVVSAAKIREGVDAPGGVVLLGHEFRSMPARPFHLVIVP